MSTYRNKKLLALARLAPRCFCCGHDNDGTIVAAHANVQSLGKGMGHKAADIPAFVCMYCHDKIDGRIIDWCADYSQKEWYRAAVHSMLWALEEHPEVFK